MPVCIKHCTSRTSHSKTKNVKFFRFPKEAISRQQWLKVSQRTKLNIKVDTAICSNHFDTDCFAMVWTKPRLKNILPARKVQRLKKGCIPTKMLILKKKRKIPESKENIKRKEKNVPTGISTYAKVPGYPYVYKINTRYKQEKHHLQSHKEIVQHVKAETAKNVQNTNLVNINNIKKVNNFFIEEILQHKDLINDTTNVEILEEVNNHDVSIKNGSMKRKAGLLLRKALEKLEEERLNKILERNKKMNMQIKEIYARATQTLQEFKMSCSMDRKKQANTIPTYKRKILTPGQIAKLSTKRRIEWSYEDEVDYAIYLNSLSPKVYKYLTKKKMPLPSVNTLQNWIENINLKN